MWKRARNNQVAWFIGIAIFNPVGILPILYIVRGQKDNNKRCYVVEGQRGMRLLPGVGVMPAPQYFYG